MSARPLQTLNSGQLNTKAAASAAVMAANLGGPLMPNSIKTPVKKSSVSKPSGDNSKATKKKKEKLSALCKTPPSVVRTRTGRGYQRGSFLGEGGFARCFQMKDESGKVFAAKTVAKESIKNEKTKTKLLSEIKIHKSMVHPNVVQFIDCFEDNVNVYILLEICPNQSLMELLKTRKILTEPEVRFFMVQVIGAIKYLHRRRVIHRDLKLGNIFFDPDMNLKLGDFGLASVISSPQNRRYTICGTPNYIAPEVLGGKNVGHSFEVDIWAIGIMMYALLFGKPPFQNKDVKVIYERIKANDFSFPEDSKVSEEARILIKDLLAPQPHKRPNVDAILEYEWFRSGPFPARMTKESLKQAPRNLSFLTPEESLINFSNWKSRVGINDSYKAPVEILKTDLESDRPKTLLPNSLSPGNTKNKYQEVANPISNRPREKMMNDLNNAANEDLQTSATIEVLNNTISKTLSNIKRIEESITRDSDCAMNDTFQNNKPIVISKWVDYSNKHGFAYQLSSGSFGLLFNNGETVMTVDQNDEIFHFVTDEEGWKVQGFHSYDVPSRLKNEVGIVDFFKKYMTANLSDVSSNIDRKNCSIDEIPVFLRRYTRNDYCMMFEMSNDSFQFNFKDHHKLILSNDGSWITHISPSRKIESMLLSDLLTNKTFNSVKDEHFDAKFNFIKFLLRKKLTSF